MIRPTTMLLLLLCSLHANAEREPPFYRQSCVYCHEAGVAGAPRTGDVSDWNARLRSKGLDGLVRSAVTGFNAHPPLGLCYTCQEDDFRALIIFMSGDQVEGQQPVIEDELVRAPDPEPGPQPIEPKLAAILLMLMAPHEEDDSPEVPSDPGPTPDPDTGGTCNGEAVEPIVVVEPIYPSRPVRRGTEGYCEVEFTVNESGAVEDPQILACDPPGVFDRESLAAINKFKYVPCIENGDPKSVPSVRYRFDFVLRRGRAINRSR